MSTCLIRQMFLKRNVIRLKVLERRRFSKSTNGTSRDKIPKKHPFKKTIMEFAPYKLELEFNRVGTLVDGSVLASCGNTSVIVTATTTPKDCVTGVDYKLRPVAHNRLSTHPFAATYLSRLPVLCARAVDRSVRVCIPEDSPNGLKIDCVVLSNDLSGDHLLLAINGVHAVLSMIQTPYIGPMAAVRVGCTNSGEFIFNPTAEQLRQSMLNLLLVVDANKNIVMLEVEANNVPNTLLEKAVDFGVEHGQRLANIFRSIAMNKCLTTYTPSENSFTDLSEYKNKLHKILENTDHTKNSRDVAYENLTEELMANCSIYSEKITVESKLQFLRKEITNEMAVKENRRLDGRKQHEIRPIDSEVNYIKFAHGSARFQRGETQVIAAVTFDGEASRKLTKGILYSVGIEDKSNFQIDYYFHSFCTRTGHLDAGRKGPAGSSRREVGHATIGEKALRPLLPENFPFKIKITSDITDSSGSTSMATICAGSLALMDAGVNISEPAAGVAIGLMTLDTTDPHQFVILNDIQGFEDHSGYMDFKIGGTKSGITAAQFDTKLPGLPAELIKKCFHLGQVSISQIVDKMTKSAGIKSPNVKVKDNAPVLKVLKISEQEAVRFVGRMSSHRRELETQYGIQVNLEEDGLHLYAPNEQILKEAEAELDRYYQPAPPELVTNNIYEAIIVGKSERQFMLRIHPNMDDVSLDVSQVTSNPIQSTEQAGFDIGDKIQVKYFGRDPVSGKMRFSRSALFVSNEKIVRQKEKKSVIDLIKPK